MIHHLKGRPWLVKLGIVLQIDPEIETLSGEDSVFNNPPSPQSETVTLPFPYSKARLQAKTSQR
jgi:hypothetical protein